MAESLPPISISNNQWVDLYAATGIDSGTSIVVQNTGSNDCALVESDSQPNISTTGKHIIAPKDHMVNEASNIGAWAFSALGTTLQVEVD